MAGFGCLIGLSTAAAAPSEGGQTVVTGSRTPVRVEDAVVPTEVISRREIEASGARDLSELLVLHPGAEVVWTFRGAGLRLQGLDPEYVLVLIDGQRVTGRVGGAIDLSRFSLRDIEQVEIVKGPASALYGSDAIGGVVNLITRKVGKPFELNGRGQYGSRGEVDLRANAGTLVGPVAARVGAGHRGAEPYDLNPSDVATNGAGFVRRDADAFLEWKPSDQTRVTGRTGYLIRDERAIDLAPSGAVFDRHGRSEQFDASLWVRTEPREGSALTARGHFGLFRDQLLQDQRGAVDLDEYSQNVDRLGELGLQWDQLFGPHKVTAGVEYLYESLLSGRLETGRGRRQRLAFLAQDEWRVLDSPALVVSPGARVDLDSRFGSSVSPRLAVRYEPAPGVALRAAYGWGFRAPSFQEQFLRFENPAVGYVVQGNPNLGPETSRGLNVSADAQLSDWMSVSASVFRTDIRGLISIVTLEEADADSPLRYGYGNLAAAYSQGAEAGVRLRPWSGTYLDFGYMLLHTRDLAQGRPLEGRAVHRGTAQLLTRHRPTRLELMVRGAVFGPRTFFPDLDGDGVQETVRTATYADLSAQLSWKALWGVSVFVLANNLFNSADTNYLVRPPRSFAAGLSFQY